MKTLKLVISLLLFATCFIQPVSAEETVEGKPQYPEEWGVEGVDFDVSFRNYDNINDIHLNESVPSLYAWPGYSLRNIKNSGTWTDYNIVISNSVINAGSSKSLTVSKSIKTTVEGVSSFGAQDFNVKIGVSTSAEVSISETYNVSCPTSYGGRTVAQCNYIYYPRMTTYTFDEYLLEVKSGSGSAKVFSGLHEGISYIYK
ncbi:hypothetical protein [Holdemania massiliensis]|uniref:hypothetical protein n=1 Tax=Holdemania massiliensis TaxID=1468449 RepID=UPI001F06A441|nr:hypothetical protein [Holdemania massiliensis]MCH1939160.1 hypothetical protein [Holdemania massiliensis]